MAPAHDALSVPEVLESIVLGLPLRQMMLTRRVCREFDRIITSSTAIQRALFLLPSESQALVPHESEHKTLGDGSGVTWKNGSGQVTIPILNPFIRVYGRNSRRFESGFHSLSEYVRLLDPCSVFEYDPLGGRYASARSLVQESQGSFKNMLATQPSVVLPPNSILTFGTRGNTQEDQQASDGLNALTYGRLVERAGSVFGHSQRSFALHGGDKWAVLKKTVDEITGYEMLQTLAGGYAGSDKSLFWFEEFFKRLTDSEGRNDYKRCW
ncbi:hypothetical protein LTR37_010824 [Vermiconidia calcicola]|uniref:Uncharacterized protein n=1 Tax=Vermiconidia calcicola TaxID=1690605 RepID=A0ACC3N4H5_9PEZI|nr:hypothetical protein LTR37_010824 [Vermiconidia calcicola]